MWAVFQVDPKPTHLAPGPLGFGCPQLALRLRAAMVLAVCLDLLRRHVRRVPDDLSIDGRDDGFQVYGVAVDLHPVLLSHNGPELLPVFVIPFLHFQGQCQKVLAGEDCKRGAAFCVFADIVAPVQHKGLLTPAALAGH